MPIGAGFDEDTHLGRIWEMSKGVMIPNQYLSQGPYYPYAFYQLSYRQDVNLTPISWQTWLDQQTVKIDWDNMINHKTRAIYFPSLYIVQAFIVGIMGRLLDTPVAMMYYAVRLSYLLMFVLITYLAIRIIPTGKWLLGILSVLPMPLIQASSISPDAINNGIGFLLIAWVFYLNENSRREKFDVKEWIITLFLVVVVCTLKINSIFLLLLLFLIPRKKFGSTKWLVAFIAMTLLAIGIVFIGWNLFTSTELSVISTGDTSPAEQIKGLFTNPGHYLSALFFNIQTQYQRYYLEWVGVSGYAYWQMPYLIYILTPLLILLAVLAEKAPVWLDIKRRLLLMVGFIIIFVGTISVFYLIYNPPGSIIIPGVQGRYFIIGVPLLLLALVPTKTIIQNTQGWLKWGSVLTVLGGCLALFLVYHVTCGSSWFSGGACYLPQYKNWSPATSLSENMDSNIRVKQTFTSECGNLNQVRIWFNKADIRTDGEISMSLRAQGNDQILAEIGSPSTQIPQDGGWIYFNFPEIPASQSEKYILDVLAVKPDKDRNFEIAYSKTNEYKNGALTLNGQPQDGDLLFQYGCLTGLEKMSRTLFHK
ncbi:MAG: DUF2142 domain-containing protein [Anaerolineae bacterium]|nr:DUF2142 domain-containing protein [Anaerolineae bacterium]